MKMRIATKTCRECGGTGTANMRQERTGFYQGLAIVTDPCSRCMGDGVEPRVFACECGWEGFEHEVEGVGYRDEYRDVCPECGGIGIEPTDKEEDE